MSIISVRDKGFHECERGEDDRSQDVSWRCVRGLRAWDAAGVRTHYGGRPRKRGYRICRPLAISLTAPATLDPHGAQDESALTFAWQLFDSLTSYDFFSGELSCLAAERFEASEDARTFTFHVRDAVFHNGEAVTARISSARGNAS